MKNYFKRALGYFCYISILVILVFTVLIIAGVLSSDINSLFQQGWLSVLEILLCFALISLIYPKFGYTSRLLALPGDPAENEPKIIEFMNDRGYKLVTRDGGILVFESRSFLTKLLRYFCEQITFTPTLGGYELEGQTKEVTRLLYAFK